METAISLETNCDRNIYLTLHNKLINMTGVKKKKNLALTDKRAKIKFIYREQSNRAARKKPLPDHLVLCWLKKFYCRHYSRLITAPF